MRALLVLSGSLSMTIQLLGVAVKGWIQNNASRLCVTTNRVWTWKAHTHNSSISCDNTLLKETKKRTQKIENPKYRKIFIFFSLKETESLEGWWWWWWLRPGFGSCTFCTLYSLNSRFVPSFCRPGRICHALIQQTFTKALLCPGPHGRFCIQRNDKDLASDLWEFRTRGSESQNIQTHTDSLGSVSDPGGMFVCFCE